MIILNNFTSYIIIWITKKYAKVKKTMIWFIFETNETVNKFTLLC